MTHRCRGDGWKAAVYLQTPVGQVVLVRPDEWTILRYFDGSPLDDIECRLRQDHGFEFAAGELAGFVRSAAKAGLLETQVTERPGRRINPFFVKIPLCNPDRFLDWLEPKLRFMLVPAAWWFGCVVIIAGVIASGGSLRRVSSIGGSDFLVFLLCLVAVGTAHELGHAVTLKHFGGRVRESGLLVNWFVPGFFCDVTESYLLEHRAHRVAVLLAGPFVQATVGGLAALMLAWEPVNGSPLGIPLSCIAIIGFLAPINLFPLSRSDGYYLVTEYADIPNLRGRARAHLATSLFRRRASPQSASRRDSWVLLTFGTLAVALGILVLAGLSSRAVAALLGHSIGSAWAIVGAAAAVVYHLHRSVPTTERERSLSNRESP